MQGLPFAVPGQRIGLLGGSFDPPHAGHAHISREAMRRFALDRVWWLVSPGNPLKSEGPATMPRRLAAARDVIDHPRILVSDLEARLGTRYTAATLAALMARYPGVRFVWLMGADNLASFHRWDRWTWIMENVPVGVIARPGLRTRARRAKAALRYAAQRLPAHAACRLAEQTPPAWCFINVPMTDLSSTTLRERGMWRR